ncbi:MAG TPA: hypothetical protein VJR27_01175 [Candidatus Saccharimonadales bacterium]|nr:hypothetical protein [Candidatus Saccharimonadales bacterium]
MIETDPTNRVLDERPLLSIQGVGVDNLANAALASVTVGTGEIALHPEKCELEDRQLRCTFLAALGLTDLQIGNALYMSKDSVKKHLRQGMDALEIAHNRLTLARYFLDRGPFEVTKRGVDLGMTGIEKEIVDTVSRGSTLEASAQQRDRARSTVKTQLAYIAERSGWHTRGKIVLASLVSGEIGEYAPPL